MTFRALSKALATVSIVSLCLGCSTMPKEGRGETPKEFVDRLERAIARDPRKLPVEQYARYYYVHRTPDGLGAEAIWIGLAAIRMTPGRHMVRSKGKLPSILTHAGCLGSIYITAQGDDYDLVCDVDRPLTPPPIPVG